MKLFDFGKWEGEVLVTTTSRNDLSKPCSPCQRIIEEHIKDGCKTFEELIKSIPKTIVHKFGEETIKNLYNDSEHKRNIVMER